MEKHQKQADVILIPVNLISASPYQARTDFNEKEIKKLAVSIVQNGLLQPISVREAADGEYQLIAGERRWRACKMAAMDLIPAIVWAIDDQKCAALSLLENIQREQLGCFEQARALKELVKLWDCTQEAAAHRLGMSQSSLANKLRILSLTDEQQAICNAGSLTERHARAVLALSETQRTKVLNEAVKKSFNVEQTEYAVARLMNTKTRPIRKLMVKDVRIFVNSINKAISIMVAGGIQATSQKKEDDEFIEYVVRIPRYSGEEQAKRQEAMVR